MAYRNLVFVSLGYLCYRPLALGISKRSILNDQWAMIIDQ